MSTGELLNKSFSLRNAELASGVKAKAGGEESQGGCKPAVRVGEPSVKIGDTYKVVRVAQVYLDVWQLFLVFCHNWNCHEGFKLNRSQV